MKPQQILLAGSAWLMTMACFAGKQAAPILALIGVIGFAYAVGMSVGEQRK